MRSNYFATILGVLLSAGGAAPVTYAQTANSQCDRACLEGFVDQYLDALVAHDPGGCPWQRTPDAPRTAWSVNG